METVEVTTETGPLPHERKGRALVPQPFVLPALAHRVAAGAELFFARLDLQGDGIWLALREFGSQSMSCSKAKLGLPVVVHKRVRVEVLPRPFDAGPRSEALDGSHIR